MAREGEVGRGTGTQGSGQRNLQQRMRQSPGQVSPGCNLSISGWLLQKVVRNWGMGVDVG